MPRDIFSLSKHAFGLNRDRCKTSASFRELGFLQAIIRPYSWVFARADDACFMAAQPRRCNMEKLAIFPDIGRKTIYFWGQLLPLWANFCLCFSDCYVATTWYAAYEHATLDPAYKEYQRLRPLICYATDKPIAAMLRRWASKTCHIQGFHERNRPRLRQAPHWLCGRPRSASSTGLGDLALIIA